MVAVPLPGRDVLVRYRSGQVVVQHLQVCDYWLNGERFQDCAWYPGGGQLSAADGGSWSFWREIP